MSAEQQGATFGRVITAMATPFTKDGHLDVGGCATLARYLVENGSDALVLTGSTGENSVLTDDERFAVWAAVCGEVKVPVIVGSTSNDTGHSVELTARANQLPIAGVLVPTPYYNRPHQDGLAQHFTAVAQATHHPVILYDIPIRSGRKIAIDTVLRLANDVPNIVALKDAAGDPASTARLLRDAPEGFEVYSGDDALTLPLLAVGAVGLISVASHWAGTAFGAMITAFLAGDIRKARLINSVLISSYNFESGDNNPNPIPLKAMLRVMGLPSGQCRLPLGDAPDGLEERAKVVLSDLDTWRNTLNPDA